MTGDNTRKAEIKKAVVTLRVGSENYGQARGVGEVADIIKDHAVGAFLNGDTGAANALRNLWSDVEEMHKGLMNLWRECDKTVENEAWETLLGSDD